MCVTCSSYFDAHGQGWWSTELHLFAEPRLPRQDPPRCSQSTAGLWGGSIPRPGCAPRCDTGSDSCSGFEHWWWCCHQTSRRASKMQSNKKEISKKIFIYFTVNHPLLLTRAILRPQRRKCKIDWGKAAKQSSYDANLDHNSVSFLVIYHIRLVFTTRNHLESADLHQGRYIGSGNTMLHNTVRCFTLKAPRLRSKAHWNPVHQQN